jgi:hypothetical protein
LDPLCGGEVGSCQRSTPDATVPESSTLFGFEAVDAIVRAMAGQPPAEFVQPTYLVTRENVNAEGGDKNQFIPSNNFVSHYVNIWKGENKASNLHSPNADSHHGT